MKNYLCSPLGLLGSLFCLILATACNNGSLSKPRAVQCQLLENGQYVDISDELHGVGDTVILKMTQHISDNTKGTDWALTNGDFFADSLKFRSEGVWNVYLAKAVVKKIYTEKENKE